MKLSTKAIDYSLQRLSDFATVNGARSVEEKVNSLDLFAEGAGLSNGTFTYLLEQLTPHYEDDSGFIATGVLIGLYMAEFMTDQA